MQPVMTPDAPDITPPAPVSPLRRFGPLAVLAAGLVAIWAAGGFDALGFQAVSEARQGLSARVAAAPVLAAVLYGLVYVVAVAFSLPVGTVLTLLGGFLFGWKVATPLIAVTATIGAALVFLAARSAFGGALRQRVSGRAARLADGFENDAFFYLLALRLAPVFPFFVVNIAPALFSVPLRTYVAATFVGILPGTAAFAFLGEGLDAVFNAAAAEGRPPSLADLVQPEITAALVLLGVIALAAPFVRAMAARLTARRPKQEARP